MGRGALALLAVVVTLLNLSYAVKFPANDEEVTSSSRPKFRHDSSVSQAREWIDGPDGRVYQFHVGDQSWLSARELCLSQNSELVVLRSKEQIDWLLSHYAPTYTRFSERYMQIGLMMPDGPNRDWTYLDGSKYNQSVVSWLSGEPFDHSADGRERCGILRVHARVLDDIDCEAAPSPNVHMRFVCERDQQIHKQQQTSQNFIWSKLEKLLEYFGFSSGTMPSVKPSNETDTDDDYFDELKKIKITSKEREELKNIKIDRETSSEEQRAVESTLKILNKVSKPGATAASNAPEGEDQTSRPSSQEDRPNTSSELLTEATTLLQTQENKRTSEATFATETTEASNTVTEENTVTAIIGAKVTGKKAEASKTAKDEIVRARAAPLKEITETEGSGADVARSEIEDSSKLHHEIGPEKLEKIITTMEKMIENLEKVHVKERKSTEKKEEGEEKKQDSNKKGLKKKGKSSESLVRIGDKVKEDTETMSAMEKDFDEEASKNLPSTDIKPPEEECDEEASGDMAKAISPTEEIINNTVDTEDVDDLSQKPKIPAEKEAHIQDFLTTLRTFLSRAEHSDLRKLLDQHPEKTLLEKMKLAIKAANEREFERLKELELMKKHGVDISHVPEPKIMGENEREELFNKISRVVMVEAEKKGEETVTQPSARTTTQELHRTTQREVRSREILIRKSSKEFISKENARDADDKLKDVTPITKKENEAKPAEKKEKLDVDEKKEEKEEEKAEEKKDEKVEEKKEDRKEEKKVKENVEEKKGDKKEEDKVEAKTEEKGEEKVEVKKEGLKEEVKEEEKQEEKEQGTPEPTEPSVQNETTAVSISSAEMPARTVQLKEFDNKEEIMSKESKTDVKESAEVKPTRKEKNRSEELEEEKPKDDKELVKTEPLTSNDLKNQENDESGEENKTNEDEDEVKEVSTSPPETKSSETKANATEAGEEKEKKEGENEKKKGEDYVKTQPMTVNDLRNEGNDESEEQKATDAEDSGDDDKEKTKKDKNYVKTEPLKAGDLRNQDNDSDEAKEDNDEDDSEPKELNASPSDPKSEPKDNDGDLTEDNASFDSDHVDKSNMDNSFDSEQVDKSLNIGDTNAHTEPFEESVSTVRMPIEEDDEQGEEVATEKTPEARREEKRRLEKAKRKKDRKVKVEKDAPKPDDGDQQDDDASDPKDDDANDPEGSKENAVTLPTLPTLPPLGQPLPTLPPITPMPGFDNLLQTISEQWRKIFPNAKIPSFKPDE